MQLSCSMIARAVPWKSPLISLSSLDSDPVVQKVTMWKCQSFPQDFAAETWLTGDAAHMFWTVWRILLNFHKVQVLLVLGALLEAMGAGSWGRWDRSERDGVGPCVQNESGRE